MRWCVIRLAANSTRIGLGWSWTRWWSRAQPNERATLNGQTLMCRNGCKLSSEAGRLHESFKTSSDRHGPEFSGPRSCRASLSSSSRFRLSRMNGIECHLLPLHSCSLASTRCQDGAHVISNMRILRILRISRIARAIRIVRPLVSLKRASGKSIERANEHERQR